MAETGASAGRPHDRVIAFVMAPVSLITEVVDVEKEQEEPAAGPVASSK